MRTALVTGASRGFGQRTAVTLARRGWFVFATMRDTSSSEPLERAAASAGVAGSVSVVRLDVLDGESIDAAKETVLGATGGVLDALICNAGVATGGVFEHYPAEEFRRVFDTNFYGTVDTTRAFLPAVRRSRGGLVVLSSDYGLFSAPALSAYNASKFALEGWTEALWYELRPFGVNVVLLEPGAYKTGIWDGGVYGAEADGAYGDFMGRVEAAGRKWADRAGDCQPVADTIATALDRRRPKLRYPVGADAWALAAAKGILPDRLRAIVVRQQTGLTRWRPPARALSLERASDATPVEEGAGMP
ncbi:MAG TPA: SDR family NAD(P)-dependent oxidoreductase [Thermoleophilaceae bacterium]|jgi:NAD(P)-dependent dehydrogenase (short-subunit alcohol dehydrogenase family)